MGTRAIITKDGKPFIATHYDGNPSSLGRDLLNKSSDEEIIKAAVEHTIDFADEIVCKIVNPERYAYIANKANEILKKTGKKKRYTIKDIEDMDNKGESLTFGVQGAGDYPVGSIGGYNDFAEYQYDLKEGKFYFRELSGEYPKSLKTAGKFVELNQKELDKLEVSNRLGG